MLHKNTIPDRIALAALAVDEALDGMSENAVKETLSIASCVSDKHKALLNDSDNSIILRIPRLPWDTYFMLQAALVATRSTCNRGPELFFDPKRHGVGAVIVHDNRMVASGYNGSPPGEPHCDQLECPSCDWTAFVDDLPTSTNEFCPMCGTKVIGGHIMKGGSCIRTLHAEENALLQCAIDGVSPRHGTMYTTASPCWDCAKRLVRVGIDRLVYGTHYESRYGLSDEACKLLNRSGIVVEYLDLMQQLSIR